MCGTNVLCKACNSPAVVAWIEGRRHHQPPFGDQAQMLASRRMRAGTFWSEFNAGSDKLASWPEFDEVLKGIPRRKNHGIAISKVDVARRIVGNLSLLRLPARHLDEQQMLKLVRATLIRVRVLMKSCAVDQHSGRCLYDVPALLLDALDPNLRAGLLALSDESRRVKNLPTKTKRQMRHRRNEIKALRRRIVDYAQIAFEGQNLVRTTQSLLALVKLEVGQEIAAPVQFQLVA